MFKKSLLALALTGAAISGVANAAATVTGTPAVVNLEGHNMAAVGANKLDEGDATAVLVTAKTAYITNDLIYVTVAGATFDTTINPTLTATTAGAGTADFIDYLDANTMRFRIATADWAANDTLSVDTFDLKTSSPTKDSKVTFSAKAVSVNPLIGEYDKSTTNLDLFTFQNQMSTTITKLDGEVSTGAGRAEFTASANKDTLKIASVDNAGVDQLTLTKVTHVITGDFGWMMDYDATAAGGDADGVLEAGELAVAATTVMGAAAGGADAVVYTLNSTMTELTATDTLAGGIDADITVELNNRGNALGGSALTAPQSFSMTSTYTDGTNSFAEANAAGAWTLDGSVGKTGFLPFGSDYAQSITVTNTGSVVGAITVDLTYNGMKYTKTLTATAAAKSVTNISLEVAAFAAESGVTGNAQVTVTTNAPGIIVEGLYFHKPTADREIGRAHV